ncbi:MAG: PEGA domain-containing protein [Geobacteraceae bacterium]|nr:PEGA domain-containing protein [Geobacteraceae bacterium]
MIKKKYVIGLCCCALFGFGCETKVLRQDIPVSTNPMGAKIYADGNFVGQTPGTVSLERTRNHILTLVKENYRQQDVVITKQYQSNKVLMNAVRSGLDSGLFFKDKRMGINSGFGSISRQEETGEAYNLVPATVSVSLLPLSGAALSPAGAGGYPADAAAVDSQPVPANQDITARDVVQAGVVAGAAVGAAQVKPIEKNWQTSSSSKSYVEPDGTQVTKKSSTSVGVSVNPAQIINTLDTLFK